MFFFAVISKIMLRGIIGGKLAVMDRLVSRKLHLPPASLCAFVLEPKVQVGT